MPVAVRIRVGLAGGPEKRKNSRQFTSHLGNPGLSGAGEPSAFPGAALLAPTTQRNRDPILAVLRRVLHNWDLAGKKMLLKKAYEALPTGGVLIVYERLIDDQRRVNATALLSSLNMLIMTAGGIDFSASDCIGWMREIGFDDLRVDPLTTDQSMIVGTKCAHG